MSLLQITSHELNLRNLLLYLNFPIFTYLCYSFLSLVIEMSCLLSKNKSLPPTPNRCLKFSPLLLTIKLLIKNHYTHQCLIFITWLFLSFKFWVCFQSTQIYFPRLFKYQIQWYSLIFPDLSKVLCNHPPHP